jgi:hypothetical protein
MSKSCAHCVRYFIARSITISGCCRIPVQTGFGVVQPILPNAVTTGNFCAIPSGRSESLSLQPDLDKMSQRIGACDRWEVVFLRSHANHLKRSSRMSRLSVYWPDECESTTVSSRIVPTILPFPRRDFADSRQSGDRMDIISRARLLFENRRCRHCAYPVVEPLELDDALTNSSGLEIPGTSTLVGFQCQSCDAKWSV